VADALGSLRRHWPEYLMEAAGLGLFMVAAAGFGTLLEHPASPARQAIESGLLRRALMGAAMGLTAVGLIYSPWGRRSGAHLNPAVTLTFLRLGKLTGPDAAGYVVAQFAGGLAGLLAMEALLAPALAAPEVGFVATVPGWRGADVAFVAELSISFGLMLAVLWSTNSPRWAGSTGWLAGALVAVYITLEAPFSGMSMNPARTFASAVPAASWSSYWVYVVAPLAGMLLAAEVYLRSHRTAVVHCAKFHHDQVHRCIFRCGYHVEPGAAAADAAA